MSTAKERETFYDDEVAPLLAELSRKCTAAGLSFLAVVEWAPGDTGRTLGLVSGSGFGIRMADAAAKASGNVDSFMFALMRYAREHGHSSAILHQLGVPLTPGEPPHEIQ
ncbi:MAG: hypothetical protein AB1592_11425 [Pseudomonadota bacterium]